MFNVSKRPKLHYRKHNFNDNRILSLMDGHKEYYLLYVDDISLVFYSNELDLFFKLFLVRSSTKYVIFIIENNLHHFEKWDTID